ncbi:cupin domain-containing protein, partial [Mycobacterium tuberculosis]
MAYTAGAGAPAAAVPVDLAAELAPSGAPLAELLIGPTPSCRNHTDYRSADGTFTCGVWDSTPYHRRAMRYAHFELMVLLKGSVTFVDEEGKAA